MVPAPFGLPPTPEGPEPSAHPGGGHKSRRSAICLPRAQALKLQGKEHQEVLPATSLCSHPKAPQCAPACGGAWLLPQLWTKLSRPFIPQSPCKGMIWRNFCLLKSSSTGGRQQQHINHSAAQPAPVNTGTEPNPLLLSSDKYPESWMFSRVLKGPF